MKVTYTTLALMAAVTLSVTGCNGGNSNTSTDLYQNAKSISDLTQLSDAEKLAVAMLKSNKQPDISTPAKSRSRALQSMRCTNSGTIEFEIPSAEEMQNPDFQPPSAVTMAFHNCVEEGKTANGTMKVILSNDNTTEEMVYLEDFTVESATEHMVFKKGSRFRLRTLQNGWEEMVINADVTYNGIRHVGKDLIYRGIENADGSSRSYPVSGYEQIGESALFEVDPAYDASKTPFITDKNGDDISGKAYYLDDQTHKVEITVVRKNIVSVKVDENGDGSFSEDETSLIKIP
ncbi:MAG: hypothetical protein DSZ05_09355 [Sulfurospirillum sp.]|nr:MAG: hypothetical protein DSZ05_09355 [Sulfurospirillum sp.]